MKSYEVSAVVQPQGDIRLVGVPFAPGTEVDVTISPKRKSAVEFARVWEQVCRELRTSPTAQAISDDEIQQEIDDYRTGR
jgi:hypothetical protein